mgnify:CR=1 FL=1
MKITIRQKDLEITPPLQEYIEKKVVQPVQKFLKRTAATDLPVLDIEVGRTTKHHHKGLVYHASATLMIGKRLIRAEATDADIYAACDQIERELKREIDTFKSKTSAVQKRAARAVKRETRFTKVAQIKDKGRVWEEGR